MPRSWTPRQHRSASTSSAERPPRIGKSGKWTCFRPRSNVHRSATSSVASQRSGRSAKSARISAGGFSHPSAFIRVTLLDATGTIARMHSSASARNASSGTRYRTGFVATATASSFSANRSIVRVSVAEPASRRSSTATMHRSGPKASRNGAASRAAASTRPATASRPGCDRGPSRTVIPAACAQICSVATHGSPRSPNSWASVRRRQRFAYPVSSSASSTTWASRGGGAGARTVREAPRMGFTPLR